jgi:hypothetical protein
MNAPPGIDNGFITGIVLDGNECWMTEAFDTNKLYYSSDSAKTFTFTMPVTNSSFQFLTKARKGRALIGGNLPLCQAKYILIKEHLLYQDIQWPLITSFIWNNNFSGFVFPA